MYDIVSREYKDGIHIYKCWLDKKETKLNRELAKLFGIQWNKEKGKYHSEMNLDHFSKSLFLDLKEELRANFFDDKSHYFSFSERITSVNKGISCPPPELI